MRITNRLVTNNSISGMADNLEKLYRLQQKGASGKKYLYASENPAIAADGMTLRSSLRSIETYNETINSTQQWMETTDFALQKIVDVLGQAQNIILKGLDDNYSVNERKIMGTEIDGLLNQAIEMANFQDQGRYVFGGYMTKTRPFVMGTATQTATATIDTTGTALPAPPPAHPTVDYTVDTVVYQGDMNTIERDIARSETVTVNVNGGDVFTGGASGGAIYDSGIDDMFATMIRLRDYLQNEDYLKVHADDAGTAIPGDDSSIDPSLDGILDRDILGNAYTHLQNITENVTEGMTANGARLKNLRTTLERSERATLEIESILSQNEDVNLAEIITEISNQELIYQTSVRISGKIGSMLNLFDVLQ